MQDPASELLRISLPRTPVNKPSAQAPFSHRVKPGPAIWAHQARRISSQALKLVVEPKKTPAV
jgi:hypothetical protein